ncbi:hypothetical protein ASG22_16470 [Chryseobacterium sp. Leaf405]|uniref:TetR/AcrR family transcriptional regulator n=1 Tax=Chryseobacterium sp. Leaf405 TaxID=1736367 RepID=UPI0006F9B836|nr:TetR/AcrR family transcriptional regulator [Chryseobacterium sp. Leaf405]KQT21007.1 hypothetical protein ASG22_16470 [Chryseobacterium sp. Leaf405]
MSDTEYKIKNATMDLLLKDGNFGFTLYDVAEKSKVSRTVIHYYFRSRENLLSIVTKEILANLVKPRHDKLLGKENLKTKILRFLEASDKTCEKYPYIDVFLMVRHTTSKDLQTFFDDTLESFKDLMSEVEYGIDRKKIKYKNAQYFLSDLFALSSFSYIFSNFFCTLDIESIHQIKFIDCSDKNTRILKFLFTE